MARSIRIEFPGAFDHVMAWGNRREPIFDDSDDRRYFLRALGEACERTGWQAHAWALMSNHYHLVLETPETNLVAGMQWLQNTYTRRYNLRHKQWGRLFGDHYKALVVRRHSSSQRRPLFSDRLSGGLRTEPKVDFPITIRAGPGSRGLRAKA